MEGELSLLQDGRQSHTIQAQPYWGQYKILREERTMSPETQGTDCAKCFSDPSKVITEEYENIPALVLSKLVKRGYSPLVCKVNGVVKVCYEQEER